LVFDSPRPSSIARFWAAALDGYAVAPYDDAELARLRAKGITDIMDDPSVLVEPSGSAAIGSGPPPRLIFQLVPESKVVKNRVHLDLTSSAADRDQEIDRLLALGARRVDIGQTGEESWTVLADPEGNEFCVVRPKETLIR